MGSSAELPQLAQPEFGAKTDGAGLGRCRAMLEAGCRLWAVEEPANATGEQSGASGKSWGKGRLRAVKRLQLSGLLNLKLRLAPPRFGRHASTIALCLPSYRSLPYPVQQQAKLRRVPPRLAPPVS